MFCGYCGAQNPDQNRFCVECGSRLQVPLDKDGSPVTDDISARLAGFDGLPEPSIDWPKNLPRDVIAKDGKRMVLVPAGFFWMGAHKQKKDERPYRMVYLDSFYMDVHPVTNDEYSEFLSAKRRPLKHHRPPRSDRDWGRRPVTRVTWDDANAYARWALKRLPTEAEWEKSARGIDGRLWPWGNDEPTDEYACLAREDGPADPVGSHPKGVSPYGIQELAGSVWEWCADQYGQFYYPRSPPRNPKCEDGDPRYRIARGGAVTYSAFTARCSYRGWNLPHMRSSVYGFRCAVDAIRYRGQLK